MSELKYVGSELELFGKAHNWKSYYGRILGPYLGETVLEVGAGAGLTTPYLITGRQRLWTALEPDPELAARVEEEYEARGYASRSTVICGTLDDAPEGARYSAVLYIDVLEHIEDDRAEVARAAERIEPGGRLIVLGPAHQFLFSEFDDAIGHFRRYTTGMLEALTPPGLQVERSFYLDSAGILASLGNRLLLRSSMPTPAQIQLWDRYLTQISRVLDPLLLRRLGKTAITIWHRP
ncbi:MAG: class I SAM-dependent methyltransferase [Bryobacterales bacterium]|nr:class I SAM-dependent methyltransferase [Acidobacteriota bacterium]MCB9385663.1 class I SAM-dependent methyltransferase [Bryobacterales bacterium]